MGDDRADHKDRDEDQHERDHMADDRGADERRQHCRDRTLERERHHERRDPGDQRHQLADDATKESEQHGQRDNADDRDVETRHRFGYLAATTMPSWPSAFNLSRASLAASRVGYPPTRTRHILPRLVSTGWVN